MRPAVLPYALLLATTACSTVSKLDFRRTPQDIPSAAGDAAAGSPVTDPSPGPEPLADEPKNGIGLEAGNTAWSVRAHYGMPIVGKSLFWTGLGDVDDFGLGAHAYWFPFNRLILGAGFNPTVYLTPGHDVFGFEFEAMTRWYVLVDENIRLFVNGNTGWLQSTDDIPPGGTEWNMTFGFGAGIDVPLDEGTSVLLSADYHHKSNALGQQNDTNPSQNEVRFWVGFASDW